MTTDAQTALAQVREALSAGPTPGPWHHDSDPIKNDPLHRVRFRVTAKGRTITETYYSSAQPGAPFTSGEADNRFIAACSPANMTAILDHVEAQAAEIKRLRKLAMTTHLFEEAPCFLCGYNDPGYYQPEQHPCAALYHEAMEEQQ